MSSSYQDFHIDHPYAQTTRARPGHKPRNEELVTWPPPEMGYTHLEEGRSEQYLSSSAGRRRGKSAKTHSEPIRAMKDQLSKENSLEDATSSSIAKDNPVTSQSTKNKSSNSLPDELLAEPQDEDGFYEIYLSQNFSTVDLDVVCLLDRDTMWLPS
ncbi:hypothetical protein SISNIDRAFT_460345 [Sistotremastrum niveocremeum HHB9708]|uniref:Uncharacterized protein n=2 Tax=Sistotremastraceae TaxID=3402574 RepID=A0A164NPB7_9AGAM|nr:hypothetical protein SISNIDRAFT_460345 [Sistotremastrum niveocremeum HHB9708]KZT31832.1 hypothetical protein SISSUDRAFT_1056208 [Sistotremastrum suecicum HHB10207 ss-3]